MAVREIIHIDEELCNGCGDCVTSCAEGAIRIVDGKARLVADNLCDGAGACIGHCPLGAITIEHREADEFDEAAVAAAAGTPDAITWKLPTIENSHGPSHAGHACPHSQARVLKPTRSSRPSGGDTVPDRSQLGHWPVQLHLVAPHAPFLADADMVVCADCAPFTIPDFHSRYLTDRAIVIGCPKLDDLSAYVDKLTQIFREASPRRVTVLRMEVPCCGGIVQAVVTARDRSGSDLPIEVHVAGIGGGIEIHGAR